MTKSRKCAANCAQSETNSSSTSTDSTTVSSEESCSSPSGPKCCKPNCRFPQCPSFKPEEIVCRYSNAIVEIHSEFILLGQADDVPLTTADSSTPLGTNTRADIILRSNGFFIKGHYIVCPASTVLLPPSLTSSVNRFPLFDPNNVALGTMKDQMIRSSRILVSVFNVNGKGCSFIYEASLIGVDGAGDLALLKINKCSPYNRCNPPIERCHPYLTFGKSRAAKDGEKVYLIGDYTSNSLDARSFNAVGAITEGLLSDHRYAEYFGFALQELVLVSAAVYAYHAGMPIFNAQGKVIGMQTSDISSVSPRIPNLLVAPDTVFPFLNQQAGLGGVVGPSEFFMRRVIKALIKGSCSRAPNCQLEVICDPVGAYYRYKKAYAGLAYEILTGEDYDVTRDYTDPTYGNQERIRLDSIGQFLSSPAFKGLVGIRVVGLAGINPDGAPSITNGYFYVPGGATTVLGNPLPPLLPVSGFLNRLLPGDIITHIDDFALGDLGRQIVPSLITWRLCKGDQITIRYRRGGNVANANDTSFFPANYDNEYTTTICLDEFPKFMDYPWYALNTFPLVLGGPLSSGTYPSFISPAGQLQNPQLPQLLGGAQFHPAF